MGTLSIYAQLEILGDMKTVCIKRIMCDLVTARAYADQYPNLAYYYTWRADRVYL